MSVDLNSEWGIMGDLAPDPYNFFSTAAGPDPSDLIGPPQNALDVYGDGSPMAAYQAQAGADKAMGGAGGGSFLGRPDVKAFVLLVIGVFMLHAHMKAD